MKNVPEILNSFSSIPEAFYFFDSKLPNSKIYTQLKVGAPLEIKRIRERKTRKQTAERVSKIANYLIQQRIKPGDKVAIIAGTRPEWLEIDLAILSCAAVSVAIYPSLPEDQVAYVLFDSGAQVVFAENEEQCRRLLSIKNSLQEIPQTEDRPATVSEIKIAHIISIEPTLALSEVIQLSDVLQKSPSNKPEVWKSLSRNSLASLVYTSGTTGPAKGVMQTHGNHLSNLRQVYESGLVDTKTNICLVLPLAHSFARLMGYLGFLTPSTLTFPAIINKNSAKPDPASVTRDIREADSTHIPLVPRLLEKMKDAIEKLSTGSGFSSILLTLTIRASQVVYSRTMTSGKIEVSTRLLYLLTSPMRKVIKRKLFGNNFIAAISGGAKLSVDVHEFFESLGIIILEGYGLTETCVATNVERLDKRKIGTVGPVLAPDIELKLNEEGEILYRGPNISLGYYNRPTATQKSFDLDGWFHTGDLGEIDGDGFLKIIGRKKELIITSGGKNIAPYDIEAKIKANPLISQAVLIGEGRKYCVALISLNRQAVEEWAKNRNISLSADISHLSQVRDEISKHISVVNETLASFESIKYFHITPEDFTIENGQLTPTLKLKRSYIESVYKKEIEEMYKA